MRERRSLGRKKIYRFCLQDPGTMSLAKPYTRKGLFMMETYIADFHTSFNIPAIKKLSFHLPHVRILGTNHCDNTQREAF